MMNTFGNLYRLTSFGESHGPAIGGVLDGVPSGMALDMDAIQAELDRRRPGQSSLTTARSEADRVEFLSGIYDGVTLGTPIGFIIPNTDSRSKDYSELQHLFRPGHADYTYTAKYGLRDHRGGGRSSARETAVRVVAGAIARQALAHYGISVLAWTQAIGSIEYDGVPSSSKEVESSTVRCPDPGISSKMEAAVMEAKQNMDSLGGVVAGVITGLPAGIGEPIFGKLQAMLASSMMSINASKGFEYGLGFAHARMRGSETIDIFEGRDGKIHAPQNFSGGIQGGISNGEPVVFRVAFKPVASLARKMTTVDDKGEAATLELKGRHDPCVVPRAVPVVEAMACMTVLDALLLNRISRI